MKYSLIFPVFNEEENVQNLYKRTSDVMKRLRAEYEIIFINDGSYDRTYDYLKKLNQKDKRIKIVNFSRNFGHQIAVSAGLQYVSGDYVAVLDADLQDPPEMLPKFFAKLEKGYDAVYAIRKNRKEGILKKIAYSLFYRLLKKIANIKIPLDSGDFCVMTKRMVKTINALPERNRFVRGLRSWIGFKQTGLVYERDARMAGKSKYSFGKLVKLAFDGIFSFSYVPLQFMFYLGTFSLVFSIIGSLLAMYFRFFTPYYNRVPGFATTIILVMFIGGLNLFAIGLMGEYMRRIYDEIKQRPQFIVESTTGFN